MGLFGSRGQSSRDLAWALQMAHSGAVDVANAQPTALNDPEGIYRRELDAWHARFAAGRALARFRDEVLANTSAVDIPLTRRQAAHDFVNAYASHLVQLVDQLPRSPGYRISAEQGLLMDAPQH